MLMGSMASPHTYTDKLCKLSTNLTDLMLRQGLTQQALNYSTALTMEKPACTCLLQRSKGELTLSLHIRLLKY